MSFFETPLRRLYLVRAAAGLVVGLVILALPWLVEGDAQGRQIIGILAGVCGLGVAFNIWRWRRASPQETVTIMPERMSLAARERYYRRGLWVTVIAIPLVAVWTAWNLYRLESGAVRRVTIVEPAASVYGHLGYWPAVAVFPLLGILCLWVFVKKLRAVRARQGAVSREAAAKSQRDSEWPFDQAQNCATITTRQVVEGLEPILLVRHDAEDDGWQFIGSSAWRAQDGCLVALAAIVKLDPSVLEVADLPPGWQAMRAGVGTAWSRRIQPVDADE